MTVILQILPYLTLMIIFPRHSTPHNFSSWNNILQEQNNFYSWNNILQEQINQSINQSINHLFFEIQDPHTFSQTV